jgi:DNA processing protein
MGLAPQARHFPRRNRIISGLAHAVVVVEAAARSGSLITARDALDQGREVMAVPGHPFDARAAGCNALIRDGATLVRGTADILAVLERAAPPVPVGHDASATRTVRDGDTGRAMPAPPDDPPTRRAPMPDAGNRAPAPKPTHACPAPPDSAPPPAAPPATAPTALRDVAVLHRQILSRLGPSPLAEDQLIRDLALPAARIAPELLTLELEGRIARQPGGLLARID